MNRAQLLRGLAWSMLALLMVLALLVARMVTDGELAMRSSDLAFHRGDARAAALYARRAAVCYAPGAPHIELAYARMKAVAAGAESAGDRALARVAWQSIRGSVLETRHLWTPRRADLEEANHNLARLATSAGLESTASGRVETESLAALTRDDAPRSVWSLLAVLGFVLAGLGLAWVGWRGVTPDGTLAWREVRLAGIVLAIGTACWTLAVLSG